LNALSASLVLTSIISSGDLTPSHLRLDAAFSACDRVQQSVTAYPASSNY
jgi:hypothetical protein